MVDPRVALAAAAAARIAISRRYGGSGGAAAAGPYRRRVQSYCGPSVAHRRRLRRRCSVRMRKWAAVQTAARCALLHRLSRAGFYEQDEYSNSEQSECVMEGASSRSSASSFGRVLHAVGPRG